MDYELQDIRSFVKIAELGSFHEAADALHLSQPALSRRIKKLEDGLGTPLLERTTRRVGLTSVGRDFLPKARRLLDDFEDSILSIRELAERQTGQVTLACIPTAAFYFLPSVIRQYNEQYPKIRIRLLDLSANDGLEAVLRGEADFGINMLSGQHPDIEFVPLVQEQFVLACRRDHELAGRPSISWAELVEHRLIGVGRLSGNRVLLDHALSARGIRPKWFYEVQHLSTSLGMVEAGPRRLGHAQPGHAGRRPPDPGQRAPHRSGSDPYPRPGLAPRGLVVARRGKIRRHPARPVEDRTALVRAMHVPLS
ncbi:DNA-binding transcriptional LysR family regulator [Pseudomonas sp. SORGH_AS199]|nr:DNA-binding transcriptional LysR family regulator [Pseudomonas sp. SORGH_AS_0199]